MPSHPPAPGSEPPIPPKPAADRRPGFAALDGKADAGMADGKADPKADAGKADLKSPAPRAPGGDLWADLADRDLRPVDLPPPRPVRIIGWMRLYFVVGVLLTALGIAFAAEAIALALQRLRFEEPIVLRQAEITAVADGGAEYEFEYEGVRFRGEVPADKRRVGDRPDVRVRTDDPALHLLADRMPTWPDVRARMGLPLLPLACGFGLLFMMRRLPRMRRLLAYGTPVPATVFSGDAWGHQYVLRLANGTEVLVARRGLLDERLRSGERVLVLHRPDNVLDCEAYRLILGWVAPVAAQVPASATGRAHGQSS